MKTNCVEMSLPYSRLHIWLRIKFMLRNGWFVDKSLQDRFKPTIVDWILGISSLFVRRLVLVQCHDPMKFDLPIEESIVGTIIEWQWAQPASIVELLHSINRVKENEFLVAMGTKVTVRVGVEGFHCYPYLTRTSKGMELREIESFQLPYMLKKNKGRFWLLEIPPG